MIAVHRRGNDSSPVGQDDRALPRALEVLFVTTSFVRSVEDYYASFVFEQARSLARRGHRVRVLAPWAAGLSRQERLESIEIHRFRYAPGARLHTLAYRNEGLVRTLSRSPAHWLLLPGFLGAMMRGAERLADGADVVHAQWIPTAFAAGWATRRHGLPLFVSARGADLEAARRSPLGRYLLRRLLAPAAAVLAVSDQFREVLVRELGSTARVVTLANGVDLERFRPLDRGAARDTLGLAGAARRILAVGSLIERKGVGAILSALSHLRAAGTTEPLELDLVGEGPNAAAWREQAAALGVSGAVRFHGARPRSELPSWYAAADVLVLASASEGRPNVLLEALACGCSIVASAIPGNRELVAEGSTGRFFPPGDAAALARAVRAALDDPTTAAERAGRGREQLERDGLSWRNHGARLEAEYLRALAGRAD